MSNVVIHLRAIENFESEWVYTTGDSVDGWLRQQNPERDKQVSAAKSRWQPYGMMRSIGTFAGGCNVQVWLWRPGTDRLVGH